MYNVSHESTATADQTIHSVGIGSNDDVRKNAHEIMRNGNHFVLNVGNYDGSNYKDAKTLQEVINENVGDIATLKSAGYQTAEQVTTAINSRIDALIGAAPESLDTLKEIGDALNNDPNFAATITNELSKKVDKVDGKQLSTNDYTTAEKEKLAGLENYDDSDILNQLQQTETGVADNLAEIEKLKSGKQDLLVSGTNIKTLNNQSLLGSGNITLDLSIYKVVDQLPTEDIDANKIYLVLDTEGEECNIYKEYINVDGVWEELGTYKATVDLTPYLTKEEAASTYATQENLNAHISNTNNPHQVTKVQVGLGNVDNTSDLDKPISTAVQNVFNGINGKVPVYTVVPELTGDYTVPVNATVQEKIYEITIGDTPYNVTGAEGIMWQNGVAPIVEANSTLVVSVMNNLAVWGTFKEA